MSGLNLSIDIGNTRTKIGVFEKDKMLYEDTFTNDLPGDGVKIIEKYPEVNKIIVSTVGSNADEFIDYISQSRFFFIKLDHNTPVPIKNLYKTPQTLGKDRLAAVAGAHTIYPKSNVLIIDAGSAITYDFLSAKGVYSGGNISPGLEMRFNALNKFTVRLPKISKDENFSETGTDTETSIRCGVQWGIIYEMAGYVTEFKRKYNDLKIILTGGDANFFDKKLKSTIFVIPNLVLIGLNHILQYNEK